MPVVPVTSGLTLAVKLSPTHLQQFAGCVQGSFGHFLSTTLALLQVHAVADAGQLSLATLSTEPRSSVEGLLSSMTCTSYPLYPKS